MVCSDYIVIPYCGVFMWGWVSTTVLTGRQCCIVDAVVGGVSIWFLHPPYFVISSCSGFL